VTARRVLFLAATSSAMGEVNLARDIARDLQARGHAATFLAPAAMASRFAGSSLRHVPVDDMLPRMPDLLPRLLRQQQPDQLVLVDLASVFLTLETAWAHDPGFLCDLPVPVAALDVWDLAETDLRWDFGTDALAISPRALEIPRLVPVPFVRPRQDGRCYDALPRPAPVTAGARQRVRQEMGLQPRDRLLLLLSSRWQLPDAQFWKHHRRLAQQLPVLALEAAAALGPDVHVAHVGPRAFEGAEALGPRYHWIPQLAPERFEEVIGSADLLLSFATSSPAAFNALVLGVPVALAVNSRRGRTADEVLASLSRPAEPVRRWLETVVPLYPFRLWPIGLYGLLTPAVRDNPFNDAVRTVELLDWDHLIETCRELLFDASARERMQARQAAYCEAVRRLPRGADLLAPP
jgi:uncharacterized protein DUF6365